MEKMMVTIGARRVLQGLAVFLLLSTLGSCSTMQAAIDEQRLPVPEGLVSDFAYKLSPAKKRQIETLLLDFRNRTAIEVAVVTIPFEKMQGYPIEEYALRLGRQWGVGRDSQKRALLLLVAIKPRNAQGVYSGGTRLEVSRHLEGDVPDILAGELIRRMRDGFVAGRFDEALTTGTQTILATLAQRLGFSMEGIDPSQAVRQPVSQPASASGATQVGATQAINSFFFEMILIIVLMSIVGLIVYAISRRLRAADPDVLGHPDAHIGLFSNPSSWSSSPDSNSTGGGWRDFLGGDFGGSDGSSAGSGVDFGGSSAGSGVDFGGSSGGSGVDFGGSSGGGGIDFGGSSGGGGSDFGSFGGGGDFGGGGASDSW
jgi:uncharacterized protein